MRKGRPAGRLTSRVWQKESFPCGEGVGKGGTEVFCENGVEPANAIINAGPPSKNLITPHTCHRQKKISKFDFSKKTEWCGTGKRCKGPSLKRR